jgi:hypothetical protein
LNDIVLLVVLLDTSFSCFFADISVNCKLSTYCTPS